MFWSKIKPDYNAKFIYFLFQTINWNVLNQSTGIPSLTSRVIEHYKVFVPNKVEQIKIAELLTLVDLKIKLIQDKILTLKKYKKGLIYFILNSSKQFTKLSNLVKICNKTKLQSSDGLDIGIYPFFINTTDNSYKMTNDCIFDGEYLILNTGGSAFCNYYNGKFSAMSDCLVLKPKENSISIYFYFKRNEKKISLVGFQGTGLKHLDQDWLMRQKCPISRYNNEYLKKLNIISDNKIKSYEQQLEKLVQMKKTLLMNLFI